MLPYIVAIWVGSCHRNCMSSGWLVAHRRGPILPVSSRQWNELPVGDRMAAHILGDVCYGEAGWQRVSGAIESIIHTTFQ